VRRPALVTQILCLNTALIAATVLATSTVGRLDLSQGPERRQYLVMMAAVLVTVLVNSILLRRSFAPLESIIQTMEHVDLAQPGLRVTEEAETTDVARLHGAFNRMVDRLEQERGEAADAVLRAQEAERSRLARDLHDEVNQALTGVLLRLQATADAAPPELKDELEETRSVATQAMDQLRRLSHELRPTALDDLGLAATLRTQIESFAANTRTSTKLDLVGPVDDFRPDEQIVIYRVVQEALSNAARHSAAQNILVEVRRKGARGVVRITDDGLGIDPESERGHGLAGMRERALQCGGRLDVCSGAGRGTTIELMLGRTAPITYGQPRRSWA
jgi:two-component system sensor histidine kinase UhpB